MHGFLWAEAFQENLLKQEVREPALYNAIITAIATGASRLSEISTKVGEGTGVCSTYLKNLIGLGLVQKETPYGEKNSRKSIYRIDDNLFRFWYRFVPENNSIIARGAVDLAVLETLVIRSQMFPYQNVHLYIFSKSGFTKGCVDEAQKMGNVNLVTYEDIMKVLSGK